MFASQPDPPKSTERVKISSSCPPKTISKWLMFFEWDESIEKPFQTFCSSDFGTDIKKAWITSNLSFKSRNKRILLNGKTLSLFGKLNSSKVFF